MRVVSGGASLSIPSVDSRSVLDWSTLVLRCSLEQSCWSLAEVTSVWEDSEDRRLLGGCFLPRWHCCLGHRG